ncbi:CHAT domain-containing protein [Bacillus sp. 37MA]|uniref:CHAT domain-containing protein n=1 Tax=Bacillus sp. 37MA TaxID=1132442 RepID=UPI00037C0F75|nr:CHAT domain-containing protein [Bacillus sp. 37MA]
MTNLDIGDYLKSFITSAKENNNLDVNHNYYSEYTSTLKAWITDNESKDYLVLLDTFEKQLGSLKYSDYHKVGSLIDVTVEIFIEASRCHIKDKRERIEIYTRSINLLINYATLLESIGCVGESFNYLVKSINPDYNFKDPERELKTEVKFDYFFEGIELRIPRVREILLGYCSVYFRVSGVLGNALSESLETYKLMKNFVEITDCTDEDINFLCNSSRILFVTKDSELIGLTFLLKELLKKVRNTYQRFLIIEALLTFHTDNLESTEIVSLHKHLNKLKDRKILKYRKKILNVRELQTNESFPRKILIDSVYEIMDSIYKYYPEKIYSSLQRQRQSWIINDIVYTLIQRTNYDLALTLAFIWRTYNGERLTNILQEKEMIILAISNVHDMECWYLIKDATNTKLKKYKSQTTHADFLKLKDEIESTWMAMLEDKDTHEPKIPGNPDLNKKTSQAYLSRLNDFYSLDKLIEEVNNVDSVEKLKVFELSTFNTPFQSIMSVGVDKEIIVLSKENKKQEAQFKKVLLWIDPDMSLFTSKYELEALKYFLGKMQIGNQNITIRFQNECSKTEFIELYASETYDLIWVSGHANFDADNPVKSWLQISESEKLYLYEISEIKIIRDQRRLLVLNMCQSAAAHIRYNSMDFNGISQILTNKEQSVLGHRWLTNYLSSSTFGAILMFYLSQGLNWNLSTNYTQHLLSSGASIITSQFIEKYSESQNLGILERVNNQESIELDLIAYWGSSVYYE